MEEGAQMTRSDAYRYIRDKADQALNAAPVPEPVRCWAEEVTCMLFVFDEAPADEIIAAIYESGYVMGMEMILHTAGLNPFVEWKSVIDSRDAWSVLRDEFIKRCEVGKYGLE